MFTYKFAPLLEVMTVRCEVDDMICSSAPNMEEIVVCQNEISKSAHYIRSTTIPMISIAILTNATQPCMSVAHSLGIAEELARQGADVTIHALARSKTRSFYRPIDSAVNVVFHGFPHIEDESTAKSTQRLTSILAKAVQAGDYNVVHALDGITAKAAPGSIRTILRLDAPTLDELVCESTYSSDEPAVRYIVTSPMMAEPAKPILGRTPTVLPSGINARQFADAAGMTADAVGVRNQMRASFSSPFVLASGGVSPDNATIELLEAVTIARETIPNLELVIAGSSDTFKHRDYRISLDVRAAQLGVQPTILGSVEYEQFPSLVAACGVFVDFSETEGFAASGLEALAAGRSFVCRDLVSRREQFGQLARYAWNVDSLSQCFLQTLADQEMNIAKGQELAATYNWDAIGEALFAYYEKVGFLSSTAFA